MATKKKAIDWAAQPLGQEPDREIALRLGVTQQAVYYARRQRGIPSPAKAQRPRCDPSVFVADLGVITDREVAEKYGIHWQQAAYARRKLGLTSTKIDWDSVEGLGSAPDSVIARRLGVDNSVVASVRRRRGIPRWREVRLCCCGTQFIAFHLRQEYCSYRCQRYHWQIVNQRNQVPEAADLAVALWSFKRTLARKGPVKNVELVSGASGDHSRCAPQAEGEGDRCDLGPRRGAPAQLGGEGDGDQP